MVILILRVYYLFFYFVFVKLLYLFDFFLFELFFFVFVLLLIDLYYLGDVYVMRGCEMVVFDKFVVMRVGEEFRWMESEFLEGSEVERDIFRRL